MKTVLLFGANGFIGKNIADCFIDKNEIHFVAASREDCDLLKIREVKEYIAKVSPNYIINVAYIEVNSNVKPTKRYLSNNLRIPTNILKASKGKKIEKIIFLGSGLEYGDAEKPIDEKHLTNPKNYYAYTKAICSNESIRLAHKYDLPLILIKPFNIYGPHDSKSVIYYAIKSAINNNTFFVTKGDQVRDFLYVTDLVSFIERVLDDSFKFKHGEVLNAGSGEGVFLKKVIEEICIQTNYVKAPLIREYRENEYFKQIADIRKAERLLGWTPTIPLSDGIKRTIMWVKEVEI